MKRRGPPRAGNSQSSPYPWDQWFQTAREGEVTVRKGEDFRCRADTFQQQVRNWARRYGVKVGTRVGEGGESVTFWVRQGSDHA